MGLPGVRWAAREEREQNDLYSRSDFPKRQNLRLGSPVVSVNVVKTAFDTTDSTPRGQLDGAGYTAAFWFYRSGNKPFSFTEQHTWKRSGMDAVGEKLHATMRFRHLHFPRCGEFSSGRHRRSRGRSRINATTVCSAHSVASSSLSVILESLRARLTRLGLAGESFVARRQ